MIAYEAGLVTTGLVMLLSHHAQPALLYLVSSRIISTLYIFVFTVFFFPFTRSQVPFCLAGLFAPAWYNGQLTNVLSYTEEEEEEPKADEVKVEEEKKDPKEKKDQ